MYAKRENDVIIGENLGSSQKIQNSSYAESIRLKVSHVAKENNYSITNELVSFICGNKDNWPSIGIMD